MSLVNDLKKFLQLTENLDINTALSSCLSADQQTLTLEFTFTRQQKEQLGAFLANAKIQCLNLRCYECEPEYTAKWIEGIKQNKNITSLSLASSDLGKEHAGTIATLLAANLSHLTTLNLRGNRFFSDEGAQCIAEGLYKNTSLRELNLGNNGIDPQAFKSLLPVLIRLPLTYLELGANSCDAENLADLAMWLSRNPPLQILNLEANYIDMAERFLSMYNPKVPTSALGLLEFTLRSNTTLHTLKISRQRSQTLPVSHSLNQMLIRNRKTLSTWLYQPPAFLMAPSAHKLNPAGSSDNQYEPPAKKRRYN